MPPLSRCTNTFPQDLTTTPHFLFAENLTTRIEGPNPILTDPHVLIHLVDMTDTINMMLWGIGQAIVSDFNGQMTAVYGIVITSINVQNVKVGITVPVGVHEKSVKIIKVEDLTHAIPQILNLGQINNKSKR